MGLLINKLGKWGFIHIPKTGGTSLKEIILNLENSETVTRSHNHIGKFENIKDYFIFTFVRNPFTRFASSYYHYCRKNRQVEFKTFIDTIYKYDYWYYPQSYFINHGSDATKQVSFIGKYENYKEDCNVIFDKINYNGKVPHLNRHPMYELHSNLNQHKFYKTLYQEEWTKDFVREKYKEDFKQFNYELDI